MKILITGYPGLLSKDLVPILQSEHQVIPLSIDDLDITQSKEVFSAIKIYQPQMVINCAGYTAVDQAENDWAGAFQVNALGVHHLALACREFEVILGHISTDYVFDGQSNRPYVPWDAPNPISVYGASKRAGEFYIQSLLTRYYIIRTSSLYGKHGPNFVQAIIKKAQRGGP
jgi:dTDP-4-dehydrorhamnose reductase